jgi:hypothetical protein
VRGEKPDPRELPKGGRTDNHSYPQELGYGARGTDTEAGKFARFYLKGVSRWEIEFTRSGGGTEPTDGPGR